MVVSILKTQQQQQKVFNEYSPKHYSLISFSFYTTWRNIYICLCTVYNIYYLYFRPRNIFVDQNDKAYTVKDKLTYNCCNLISYF